MIRNRPRRRKPKKNRLPEEAEVQIMDQIMVQIMEQPQMMVEHQLILGPMALPQM